MLLLKIKTIHQNIKVKALISTWKHLILSSIYLSILEVNKIQSVVSIVSEHILMHLHRINGLGSFVYVFFF